MCKTPYKTWLLAGLLVLMPWVAHAAGLGKLTILSTLGQPLLAEVELVSVQAGEVASLVARLASPEAFTQAKIPYSPSLVGVRMSIERRADRQPYIKIISTRPVNEPFLDLLVQLSWAQGRLVREYTALIDPAGYTPDVPAIAAPPVAPSAVITPPVTSEPQPIAPVFGAAPVEPKPAAAEARPAKPPVAAPADAGTRAYGPVKRGETLGKIAFKVKPEGVTLEEMLVALYRANPDAFAGNMNYLKTGKILRIPEKESVSATGHPEALKEVRVETANWNAYRQKLAEAAGETSARELKSTASGKITTKVDDKAAGKAAPKEVLKLSKGESAAGKATGGKGVQRSAANRMRMLEEESIAREKALAEATNRIAQLEKTIKDMQRVIEIKAQVPVAKPAPKPAPALEPDLIKQIMSEPAYLGAVLVLVGLSGYLYVRRRRAQAGGDEEPAVEEVKPEIDKQAAAAGASGVLALLGGYWAAIRRRVQAERSEAVQERIAPELGGKAAAVAVATPAATISRATPAVVADVEVDPLAEADMYLNFGRDVPAEEVLKKALEKTPANEEAQLKLLQIYAGRKDKPAFEKIVRNLYSQTRGRGDNWVRTAAMGYAFDAANPLYEAGKSAPVVLPIAGGAGGRIDFDFNLDAASTAEHVAIDLSGSVATGAEPILALRPGAAAVAADTQPPVEREPAGSARGEKIADAHANGDAAAPTANVIDFQFDIPAPEHLPAAPAGDGRAALESDFKIDFGVGTESAATEAPVLKLNGISLNFDEGTGAGAPPAAGGTKDGHWYDVQTKFDLVKAYREMGEKGGARKILQEVIKEGDAGQRAEAQKLLDSLD